MMVAGNLQNKCCFTVPEPEFRVEVNNFSVNVKSQLYKEINFQYYFHKYKGQENKSGIVEDALLELIKIYFTKHGLGFKKRLYEERATGLWLYEYCSKENLEIDKKGTINQVSKAYDEYFSLGKGVKNKVHSDNLHDAEECIKQMGAPKVDEAPKPKKPKKNKKNKKPKAPKTEAGKSDGYDPKEFVDFFRFWLWQYISRNKEYIKDYVEYSRVQDQCFEKYKAYQEQYMANMIQSVSDDHPKKFNDAYDLKGPPLLIEYPSQVLREGMEKRYERAFDEFYKKYNMIPVDPEEDYMSEFTMVENLVNNNKKKMRVKALDIETVFDRIDVENSIKILPGSYINQEVPFIIDFNKPLALVQEEAFFKFLVRKNKLQQLNKFKETREKPNIDSLSDDATDALYNLIKWHIDHGGLREFTLQHAPRVIGLWLLDDVCENEHDVYRAIEEFQESYDHDKIEKMGYETDDDKTGDVASLTLSDSFIERYRRTVKCINEMKVLKIKS